ncbi:MAG: DUF4215 domain-containing protein [Myxococcales bacterium]|nr:MAG: DUF4215 domain-containing protein [Myxococcales bacterium]
MGALGCRADCTLDVAGCSAPAGCGNGQLDPGEPCDGSLLGGATCASVVVKATGGELACTPQCVLDVSGCHRCGDGAVNPGEECDDGNVNDLDACTTACARTTCGDGIVQAGEQCDDGAASNGDTSPCSSDCQANCQGPDDHLHPTTAHCYRRLDPPVSWYQARAACQKLGSGYDLAALESQAEIDFVLGFTTVRVWTGGNDLRTEGTFVWATGEPWTYVDKTPPWKHYEPDNTDGNEHCVTLWPDGLDSGTPALFDLPCHTFRVASLCERVPASAPRCRDGKVTGTEACDDGNAADQDGCTNACQTGVCGDGTVGPDEECDGAGAETLTCTVLCRRPGCGDGIVQDERDETCDDGNALPGDGCSPLCLKE